MFKALGDYALNAASNAAQTPLVQEKILGQISDGYEAVKTLAIGLMLENLRMEVIDDILAHAPSDYAIYQGFSKLKTQLRNGFASYFVDQYVMKKVLNKIHDEAVSKLGEFVLGDVMVCFKVVSTLISVASTIVFDVILDVPGIDDLTVQTVLDEYATDLYLILIKS